MVFECAGIDRKDLTANYIRISAVETRCCFKPLKRKSHFFAYYAINQLLYAILPNRLLM